MPAPESPQGSQQSQTPQDIPQVAEQAKPVEPAVEFRVRINDFSKTLMQPGIFAETQMNQMPESVVLFPKAPMDKDEKTGITIQPQFVLGTDHKRNVKDVGSLFDYSDQTVSFAANEQTIVHPHEMVVVPLPRNGENLVIHGGFKADGTPHAPLTIFENKGQFYVRDQANTVVALPKEFTVKTQEKQSKEKYIIFPPERQGEIAELETITDKENVLLSAKPVIADGIPSLLIEGIHDATFDINKKSLETLADYYQRSATRTEQFHGGMLVSSPSKRHPLRNEDAVFRTSDGVHIVLDGMGSYKVDGIYTGYQHSRLAEAVIRESLSSHGQVKDPSQQLHAFLTALSEAHAILQKNMPVDGDTTAVLSRVMRDRKRGPVLIWANIGDSRVMVVRNGKLIQVSEDDNMLEYYYHGKGLDTWISIPDKTQAMQLYESGFPYDEVNGKVYFSKEQVDLMNAILSRFHGFGMFATDSFLGQFFRKSNETKGLKGQMKNPKTDIHSGIFQLEKGDMVLTMSDGISDPLSIEDIEMVARKVGKDPQQFAQEILAQITRANATTSEYAQRGKEDDKSLIVEMVS